MAFGLDLRQGISPIGTGRTDFYNMRAAPKQLWKSTIGTYSTSAGEWPRPKPQTNEQNVPQEPTHTGSSFIATTALCRASSRSLAACHLYSLGTKLRAWGSFGVQALIPIGSIVVPFWGSYLESYKVTPKRMYYGAYGQRSEESAMTSLLRGSYNLHVDMLPSFPRCPSSTLLPFFFWGSLIKTEQ